MAKKKDEQPELSAAELLEARVDAMMDPRPDPKAKPVESDLPPLDIFAGSKSAPEVPKDLLQKVDVNDDTTPVIKAEKLIEKPIADVELDDAKSDAAIDDIVAGEGDEVLAAEDAGLADAEVASPELVDEPAGVKKHHPIFWFIILLLVILAIASTVVLTSSS